jgi:hypothetical protein
MRTNTDNVHLLLILIYKGKIICDIEEKELPDLSFLVMKKRYNCNCIVLPDRCGSAFTITKVPFIFGRIISLFSILDIVIFAYWIWQTNDVNKLAKY